MFTLTRIERIAHDPYNAASLTYEHESIEGQFPTRKAAELFAQKAGLARYRIACEHGHVACGRCDNITV